VNNTVMDVVAKVVTRAEINALWAITMIVHAALH
jgi:hypothetical protein